MERAPIMKCFFVVAPSLQVDYELCWALFGTKSMVFDIRSLEIEMLSQQ